MSPESDEPSEGKLPAKRWVPLLAGVLGIILLYLAAWGPAVFMWVKVQDDMPETAEKMLLVSFRPHFVMMYHSESYFLYSMWWGKMADPAGGLVTYKEFREDFE